MAELTPDEKKKKNKRIGIIIAIIIFLLVATAVTIFLLRGRKNKKKLEEAAKREKEKLDQEKPKESSVTGDDSFPLKKGSKGENVLYLQRALNRIIPVGYAKLKEDGEFGDKTYTEILLRMGTKYYPVTITGWTEILQKSNAVKK